MPTFWTDADLDPRRNFRFKLLDGDGGTWWWAKSVDKPSFDVTNSEYQLINHKFKYPGIVNWKPITITVADVGKRINSIFGELQMMGYTYPPTSSAHKGLEKLMKTTDGGANINGITIKQLDDAGQPAETWELYGAFITSVSMSKLDYSSDDISEITIEVAYDFAKLS